jgi:hypothetical protein
MEGDDELQFIGDNPKTPWIAWANYAWADGINTREDGFNWLCPGDVENDGVHPNSSGKGKVASLLFNFFKTDPTTIWYRTNTFLGLENQEIQMYAYPNPTNETLHVISNQAISHIEIVDLNGRIIESTDQKEVHISHLMPGVYIIRIINETVIYNLYFTKL